MKLESLENSRTRGSDLIAFLVSLVLHVSILIVLALLGLVAGKDSQGILFEAALSKSADSSLVSISAPDLEPIPEFKPQVDSTAVELNPQLPTLGEAPQVPKVRFAGALTSVVSEAADDSQSENSQASALADPLKQRGAAFFGAYAEGNRFVFVIDSSRSMKKEERWTYACNQLIDSLRGLKADQEFFVMCFDEKTSYLFNVPPKRIRFEHPATETLSKVKRWLKSRELGADTMPSEALQVALQLGPDAIFLLSDGELRDNSVNMLRAINGFSSTRKQIPIHTVHLFSLEGRLALQTIALENSGTFTPIQK